MKDEIAQSALSHYELTGAQLTFIGRSQNTTFRVQTSTGDKFLLRIHSGIEDHSDDTDNVHDLEG